MSSCMEYNIEDPPPNSSRRTHTDRYDTTLMEKRPRRHALALAPAASQDNMKTKWGFPIKGGKADESSCN